MFYMLAVVLVVLALVYAGLSTARSTGASTKPPATVSAMCYKPAPTPVTVAYVCPACGERTLYATRAENDTVRELDDTRVITTEMPACRRLIKSIEDLKIDGLKIELDESQFCAKCSPDRAWPPSLVLVVDDEAEEEPRRIEGVTADDLRLIYEFLSGDETHTDERGTRTPLDDHLERLRELLGTRINEPADQEGDGNG